LAELISLADKQTPRRQSNRQEPREGERRKKRKENLVSVYIRRKIITHNGK